MRRLAALALSAALISTAATARTLDLAKPTDALAVSRKMSCSLRDTVPAVFNWTGRAYAHVPGEPDRHLFDVEGMNIRQCVTVSDPARGTGYRLVSRELMFYLDPKTGAVLDKWTNPWSGETVTVLPVANDPVNQRPIFERGADGKPFTIPNAKVSGDWFSMPLEVPLFYQNPLGGAYQDYVGGTYHAMEIFDFFARTATVLDSRTDTTDAAVGWVRVADWLPWMKMRGRAGLMVINATGHMLPSFDALPNALKQRIRTEYPAYVAPPPGDDSRPNETSWTVFKKQVDAERAVGE